MKLIKTLVYTLIVCVSLVSQAEAKGRTASFKGGFSSQVRSVSKPAPVYYKPPVNYKAPVNQANKPASFGSFGGGKVNAAQHGNYQPSQMSRDLNTNAAQSNALKTADARNKLNSNNPPAGGNNNGSNGGNGGGSGWFRSGNNTAPQQPNYSQPIHSQPVVHQTVVHQNSGGFLHGLMWFMIGRSTVSQNNTVYVPVNNQAPTGQVVTHSDGNSWDANGNAQQQIAPSQEVKMDRTEAEERESIFTKIFRWMLWIGFIWILIKVIRKVMGFRSEKMNRAPNYSLRS